MCVEASTDRDLIETQWKELSAGPLQVAPGAALASLRLGSHGQPRVEPSEGKLHAQTSFEADPVSLTFLRQFVLRALVLGPLEATCVFAR